MQENGRRFVDGKPEIYVVSNVIENGVPIGSLGAGEAVWHTDMSYWTDPPKASMLYALEMPPAGGDTSFGDMYRAFETLPADLRAGWRALLVKHDGTYNSGGYVRQGVTPTDDPRQAPGTLHPLVCTHPESGRRMLYLGRRRMAWIEGLELAEVRFIAGCDLGPCDAARDQLDASLAGRRPGAVGQPLHHAPSRSVRCASRRMMHRTQIKGAQRPAA